jgi:3-methyladenine DNA glycosylase Mpg
LCEAFGIDLSFNGKVVGSRLLLRSRTGSPAIESSSRIGITQGLDFEWRFYQRDNPFVSGPRKRSA